LNINLEFDSAAQAAPASFRTTLEQAASMIASMFTNNITINIDIEYNEDGIGAGGAEAGPNGGEVLSYLTVYNYLTQNASPGDSTFDFMPAPSTSTPSTVAVWDAQLKAMSAAGYLSPSNLGYLSPTGTEIDGTADFSNSISPSLLLGVALHELTHAMGRVPYGEPDSTSPDIFDIDRFTSPGNILINDSVPASQAAYFSLNGGVTAWADYGIYSDPSDFLNSYAYQSDAASNLSVEDAFNQYYDTSTLQYLTPLDLEQMDMLGFNLKYDSPAEDAYDFNGGNSGDILIQSASGQIEYGNMEGGTFQGFVKVANVPGWTVVGEGQISGGVDSDIVIQNSSGQAVYADIVNGSFSTWVAIANAPGYNVVGVGDINDEHYDDVVVQNFSTGVIAYANMDNGVFSGWVGVGDTPGYSVVAVADVNNDGYDDVVLQNRSNGVIAYVNMANGVFGGFVGVGDTPGWNVVGAGDITRLGDADIVIQNSSTSQILYGDMQNGVLSNWISVGTMAGWNVVAVEDVLGNGFDDIVIQNPGTAQIDYANMTGGTFQGWVSISTTLGYTAVTAPGSIEDIETIPNGSLPQTSAVAYNGQDAEWSDADNDSFLSSGTPNAPGTPIGPVLEQRPATSNGDGSNLASALTPVSMFDLGPSSPSTPVGPASNDISNVLHVGATG